MGSGTTEGVVHLKCALLVVQIEQAVREGIFILAWARRFSVLRQDFIHIIIPLESF